MDDADDPDVSRPDPEFSQEAPFVEAYGRGTLAFAVVGTTCCGLVPLGGVAGLDQAGDGADAVGSELVGVDRDGVEPVESAPVGTEERGPSPAAFGFPGGTGPGTGEAGGASKGGRDG